MPEKCWNCNRDCDGWVCLHCGNGQYTCFECGNRCSGLVTGLEDEPLCDTCFDKHCEEE